MINIIIVIVLLGLVGWVCQLIAKIARPLGKVILVLLKFALIAGVIALVAFLVWKFGLLLWNRRATMLKVLVVIGIILAALVVIYILYACVMRVRAHKFVKWLARNGIGESREAPGDKAVWNWVNNGEKMIWYTEGQSNYFVYVPFYQNVLTHLNQEKVCAKDDFPKICRKERMMQRASYPFVLLSVALKKQDVWVENFSLNGIDKEYVFSKKLIQECMGFLKTMGAATNEEFAAACTPVLMRTALEGREQEVSSAMLDLFVKAGTVGRVQLQNMGTLYKMKDVSQGSNFVKREINLDD